MSAYSAHQYDSGYLVAGTSAGTIQSLDTNSDTGWTEQMNLLNSPVWP